MPALNTHTEKIFARITTKLGKKTNVAIAKAFGVTPAAVTNWKTRGIPLKKLHDFANKYNIPVDWLLHGEATEDQSDAVYKNSSLRTLLIDLAPDIKVYFDWAQEAIEKKEFGTCRTILKRIYDICDRELAKKQESNLYIIK